MNPEQTTARTLALNLDLHANLTGFGAAARPTAAHRRIAKHYASPLLMGPPPSELLLELVTHMFTEDEAEVAAHLPPLRPRTAAKVARQAGLPLADVERVLHNLAFNKIIILAAGQPRKYTILPIVPGTFEMALMTADLSTRNRWHRRFSELFERLWETGYTAAYPGVERIAPIRYLPALSLTKTLYAAWPSDLLEEVLEPYDSFAVGHCQCRLAMEMVGKGCGKPTENCTVFGPLAKPLIERGMMRRTDRAELIAIKREAEAAGCVTWMMNDFTGKGNGSCSCCGCCCHALRAVKLFNTPGMVSRPHFLPVHDATTCTLCRKCVKICPMEAWSVADTALVFNQPRCIGCGLCVTACKLGALKLAPVPDAQPVAARWGRPELRLAPYYLRNSVKIWVQRLFA